MPLNEWNVANRPKDLDFKPDQGHPGFVIDREYNAWFFAPPSKSDHAWYGTSNSLFRDHFSDFQSKVEITGSLRSKHFSIPIIDVHSLQQFIEIQGHLRESVEKLKTTKHVPNNAVVWYRGQTNGHLLKRPEIVSRYLLGMDQVDEPSLPGAAPRRGWNYMKVHSFLSTMLQGLIYKQAAAKGEAPKKTYDRWRDIATTPAAWDLGVMGPALWHPHARYRYHQGPGCRSLVRDQSICQG